MPKILTINTISPSVVKSEYAVRGALVTKAYQYEQQLKEGKQLPFKDIVHCNVGNPQALGQKPVTFIRNVLAACIQPELLDKKVFPSDVVKRANEILDQVPCRNLGGYSHSQGLPSVRKHVAEFIEKRDGVKSNPDRIFLGDGASKCIQNVLTLLIRNEKDGIMVPIPQYPLYSASITLLGGKMINVVMDEENNWGLNVSELERAYKQAKEKDGLTPRALVVINPGNPTGTVLEKKNMEEIVQFCHKNRLVLLADEVYQENIWGNKKWVSFRKVVDDLGLTNEFELFSFHSISKGYFGECGRRGGYVEVSPAVDEEVVQQLYKICSIILAPNLDGQIILDLMVKPLKESDESYKQFIEEKNAILDSLKRRAVTLCKMLSTLEGVTCPFVDGALYIFPKITIPKKAVAEAQKRNLHPDAFYCHELLDHTGICVVPGSGFGQPDGTFHFRTTILPPEDQIQSMVERMSKFHKEFMNKYRE